MRVWQGGIALLVAVLATESSCAGRQSASVPRAIRAGVYVAGQEANTFRECNAALRWQVEFVRGAAPRTWPPGTHGGFNASYYYARWRAELIPPPKVPIGQAPAAPLHARVSEVVELRALRPGECGEQF
jgi:hypothetical protein